MAICIEKLRYKLKIVGYRLQMESGEILEVSAVKLRRLLKNSEIKVANLTLSEDGRILPTLKTNPMFKIRTVFLDSYELPSMRAKKQIKEAEQAGKFGHPIPVDIKNLENIPNGIKLLQMMLTALDKTKLKLKISECGHEEDGNNDTAYIYLHRIAYGSNPRQLYEFILRYHRKKGVFSVYYPLEPKPQVVSSGNDAVKILADAFTRVNDLNSGRMELQADWKLRESLQSMINSHNNGVDVFQNARIKRAGSNLVYIAPLDLDSEVIQIPRFITTVSHGLFFDCPKLRRIEVYNPDGRQMVREIKAVAKRYKRDIEVERYSPDLDGLALNKVKEA